MVQISLLVTFSIARKEKGRETDNVNILTVVV